MEDLLFKVGQNQYALPLQAFVEVIANPKVSALERLEQNLVGTMLYGGEMIPVIHSPSRFGLRFDVPYDFVLITKIGKKHLGLIVDGLASKAHDAHSSVFSVHSA